MNFFAQNSLEMKVRNNNDTTGSSPFKKVDLIKDLNFGFSYNFIAERFKLSDFSTGFNTQIANKLGVVVTAVLSPYQQDTTGQPIDRYLWQETSRRRLARLTSASLNLTYQFNPANKPGRKSNIKRDVPLANDPVLGNPNPVNPYEDYVDFELPWELNASFAAQYTNPGPRISRPNAPRPNALSSAALNMSGSVKLTNNLRVGYSTGYDFRNSNVSFTSLDIFRDLHCWQITGNWRPFGFTRGYFVTIAAKSSLLQDLKLNRNRTFLNQ